MLDRKNEIKELIQGCIAKKQDSCKMLYKHFYSYAMSICIRYSGGEEEAKSIMNSGFVKVFARIHLYDTSGGFKDWLRSTLINTALDHYRKSFKEEDGECLEGDKHIEEEGSIPGNIASYELLKLIQKLNPVQRIVFSLYVIDGYAHIEIARKLNISIDTSKAYLFKARKKLKYMFAHLNNQTKIKCS